MLHIMIVVGHWALYCQYVVGLGCRVMCRCRVVGVGKGMCELDDRLCRDISGWLWLLLERLILWRNCVWVGRMCTVYDRRRRRRRRRRIRLIGNWLAGGDGWWFYRSDRVVVSDLLVGACVLIVLVRDMSFSTPISWDIAEWSSTLLCVIIVVMWRLRSFSCVLCGGGGWLWSIKTLCVSHYSVYRN